MVQAPKALVAFPELTKLSLRKLGIIQPQDLAMTLLGIYLKDTHHTTRTMLTGIIVICNN